MLSIPSTFCALVAEQSPSGAYRLQRQERAIASLPEGNVLIQVQYSALNYKDALSVTGNQGVTRTYPHTPGIDAVGRVVASDVEACQVGDPVLVTGFDLGMNTSGGFGEYIRVPQEWVIPLPSSLSAYDSMVYGTAGLTVALSLEKLQQNGLSPDRGSVLVTGATGGVGTLAIALFAHLGYRVVAVTGKPQYTDALKQIGAAEVISRAELDDTSGKPMLKGLYAAAMDTVGGNILATVIKHLTYGGSVAACGLVASPDLHTTVYPFILRGVNLLGIDSAMCDRPLRIKLWQRLATDWKIPELGSLATMILLEDVPDRITSMLAGQLQGRAVIQVSSNSGIC
jgi:putative YhdH/YhfP family quinone oxidoreductase